MIKAAAKQIAMALWPDNLSLIIGIGLITKGAALFSARAAYLTCGCLVLSLTVLHLVFGRGR